MSTLPAPVAAPSTLSLSPSATDTADTREILTFTLAEETYGLDILRVQEIRGYTGVTVLPDTPAWMKGVINLRGTIVPVMDLRLKLGRSAANYDATTVMVVINVGERVVGLVVDAVSDVSRFSAEQLRPAPELGSAIDARLIRGIAALDERMVILLDLDQLLSSALAETGHAIAAAAA